MLSAGVRSSSRSFSQATRGFRSNAILSSAAPAIATQSGGLLSLIFGSSGPTVPPMYDPLPSVTLAPPLEAAPPRETKMTTLPNGFVIASEDTPGPTASLGIYVNSGSVYETPETAGMSHLLEKMAFKSTTNRTHFNLIRSVEAIGANVQAAASREQMAYTGDSIKSYYPEVLEILADTVRNSICNPWEVSDQLMKVKGELEVAAGNPQYILMEAIHSAGYAGALGKPLLAPEGNLGRLGPDAVLGFIKENFTAPRMCLAAAGVDHDDLVALAEPLFSDLPPVDVTEEPPSFYTGGDWRGAGSFKVTHLAMAFEAQGGWQNEKDAIALTVLQTLLGGGGSFSAGGPGKGMHSKLYLDVLSKDTEVDSFTAISTIYNTTGLFGIHATSKGENVPKLIEHATKQLLEVATPNKVSQVALDRAKNSLIASIMMNLEMRFVISDDIGRQVLTYGHRKSASHTIQQIQEVTRKDITDIAAKVIKTPLTLAATGDVSWVPRYDEVAARFG